MFFFNLLISCLIYYGSLFCFTFSLGPSRTQSQHNLKTLSQPQNNECPGQGGGMGYRESWVYPAPLAPVGKGAFPKAHNVHLLTAQ